MKDTKMDARVELEDARLQAIYEDSLQKIEATRRRAAGEAAGLLYIAAELCDDGGQFNRMGSWALKFLIVMLGVIPNLLVINVLL